ncbi:hypothetical protein ID853_09285 [Xenorhabdus sp. Vera]|uniref:hypothetical protein n=1 Tax=Xenorhabdus koppenhoeferi TaxID=351659 RepID=UPI0019AE48A8|nr:hypothetical protein [Xenorhabdus sp. Vera]MBD2811066.1 hypothetical protein [Xenorhabdus sp. Vera]
MDIFTKYGALALANVIELELTDWFQGILALPTYFDLSDSLFGIQGLGMITKLNSLIAISSYPKKQSKIT